MENRMSVREIILYLVSHSDQEIPITKLMKMLFLADVEHQQLYGHGLSTAEWMYYHYGPCTFALYEATEELEDEELISCVVRPGFDRMSTRFSRPDKDQGDEPDFSNVSPRAKRVLDTVLERYGDLTVAQIKQVAYGTATMQAALQHNELDFSVEPRRRRQLPQAVAFARRAPAPDMESYGDPAASEADDQVIMRELAGLRHEANTQSS